MGWLEGFYGCVRRNGARATTVRCDICYANGCGDLTAKCDADETTPGGNKSRPHCHKEAFAIAHFYSAGARCNKHTEADRHGCIT